MQTWPLVLRVLKIRGLGMLTHGGGIGTLTMPLRGPKTNSDGFTRGIVTTSVPIG